LATEEQGEWETGFWGRVVSGDDASTFARNSRLKVWATGVFYLERLRGRESERAAEEGKRFKMENEPKLL
jgi:hypothetical protein